MENVKEYVGYDYKMITVSKNMKSAWVDSYANFGWELEQSKPAIEKHIWGPLQIMVAPLAILPGDFFKKLVFDHESNTKEEIQMKRNRKIRNKNDLNRLQIFLEGVLNEMEHLEATKTFHASVVAYLIGLLGTVCMGFSVFSYLASNLPACIGFAVPGFICWVLPFAVYAVLKNKREAEVSRITEQKFEEVHDICRKAHELLKMEEQS